MKYGHLFSISLTCCLTLCLSACGPSESTDTQTAPAAAVKPSIPDKQLELKTLRIGTAREAGPWHIIGTALADVYSKTYGVSANVLVTSGDAENAKLMQEDGAEIAFMMGNTLADAVDGVNSFSRSMTKLRQMAMIYPNYVQLIATDESGIESIHDLRGKRVSVSERGTGVYTMARKLLGEVGMTFDDIQAEYLDYGGSAEAMKAGEIDAAFFTSGLPNPLVLGMQEHIAVHPVKIEKDLVEKMAETQKFFVAMDIPANTYGNPEPVPTLTVLNALVISQNISKDDGYKLTKTLFEHLPELQASHPAAKEMLLERAAMVSIAPLHPGAARFYHEQGIDMACFLKKRNPDTICMIQRNTKQSAAQ